MSKRKRSLFQALGVAIAVTGGLVALGLSLGAEAFVGNLAAELIGAIVGVFVALFVVDRWIEQERAERWSLVARESEASLRFAVVRIGLQLYLLLKAPRPLDADPFTMDQAQPSSLADALAKLASHLERLQDDDTLDSPTLLNVTRPQLDLIRSGVMPRLLTIARDHDLIASVAGVEAAFQDLEYADWQTGRFGTHGGIPVATARLARALREVVVRLDVLAPPRGP